MNKKERKELERMAAACKGRRRNRYVDETEINIMADLDRKRSLNGKAIRVYSRDGFVPNSYKYPSRIDFVERIYECGEKRFHVGWASASRSNGSGALITVNRRAYE